MSQTPNLALPYILAAQAQKHVTHNEAIRVLDALVQLSVLDRDLTAPPPSPADGARYIVAASPTGAWAGHAGKVAAWQDGAWMLHAPREGWVAWVADEDVLVAWNGSAWVTAGGGGSTSLNPVTGGLVGVNATADTTNRLSVASPASLFNHDGAGHQQKINKAAAANSAATLFQTGFSGRAEIGLLGDDNLHFKVSVDGVSWKDALQIDRTSGVVTMPFTSVGGAVNPNLLANPDYKINQRAFAFGVLGNGSYGFDRWKAVGATDIGWDAATMTLTLNAGAIRQVVEPSVWGFPSLASQQVTVSVESLTNGNLTVAVGSASGTISPGSGRRSVTLSLGSGDTGNLNVTLTPTSYPTWWKRAKLEIGAAATAWQARPSSGELLLCMRYFQATGYYWEGPVSNGADYTATTTILPMRATPALTAANTSSFNMGTPESVAFSGLIVARRRRASATGAGFMAGTITCDAEL